MEEKNFNENVVEFLKKEELSLRESMDNCLKRGDSAMYKNLINAYEKVVFLIKQYDWELKYSKYTVFGDNGEEIKQISIWEQNGDGLIRNHYIAQLKTELECV